MAIRIKPIITKLPSVAPMPAAKHFDIVLGLDFHVLKIPWPVFPCPITPFGALIFDPMDYLHFTIPAMPSFAKDGSFSFQSAQMGGSVHVNGFYAAATTASLMGMPPFSPPLPAKFAKALGKKFNPLHLVIPKPLIWVSFLAPHDGEVYYGSNTVKTSGGSTMLSTLMCNALSCWTIGRFVPTMPTALYLDLMTRVVATIPHGKPVMIGGVKVPHQHSFADLLNALIMMGITKGGGKLLKKGLGKVVTKLNKSLSKKFPKLRPHLAKIQPHICKHLGEPVDAANGYMTSLIQGFNLPGPIPFYWEANYYSDSKYQGPMGKGMYHSYDYSLVIDEVEQVVAMTDPNGRAVGFDTLIPGTSAFNAMEKFTLHRTEKGEYFLESNDGLFYYFNDRANREGYKQIRSIANRNGYAIQFMYDNNHLLAQIKDSTGRMILVSSNEDGHITKLQAPHPDKANEYFDAVTYNYTDNRELKTFTDALGFSNKLTWQQGKIASRTFKEGTTFTFVYDAAGKCTAALGPNGLYSYWFEYNKANTVVTNSLGHKSTYHHRSGIVTRIENAEGGEKLFTYDAFNNLIAEQDEIGRVKNYAYDHKSNLTDIGLPGQGTVSILYNELNKPVKLTLPNNATNEYKYDEQGNLLASINPLQQTIQYSYSDGLLTAITNSQSKTTHLFYTKQYDLEKVTFANNNQISYKYNALGKCTSIKDPAGNVQSREYDLAGQLLKVVEPDGNIRKMAYNSTGDVIAAGDAHTQVTLHYNFFGDVTKRMQGGTGLQFNYDTEGQLINIVNEHDEIYRFEHDADGNIATEIGFDGLTRKYMRNLAGEVMQVERPGGKTTDYQYNSAGQVTNTRHSDGSHENYEYNAMGQMTRAANADSTTSFARDIMGRIIEEQQGEHKISNTYNAIGQRQGLQSSLGADIQMQFNADNNWLEKMMAVTSPLGERQGEAWESNMQYDKYGQMTNRGFNGNINQQFEYDNLGRLTKQGIAKNNNVLHQRQYSWDVDYRLKGIKDSTTGQKTFTHDVHGNLSEVIFGDGSKEYRMPDAVGNLFETADRKDRKYSKGGKLLKSKHGEYKYDAEGNLIEKITAKGSFYYIWNEAGMLHKVIRPDKEEVSFGYDALGRRLWKKFKKTITNWVWDGNVPLHEWKEFDAKEAAVDDMITWIFEENSFVPVGKIKGNKTYSIATDHLGTPYQMFSDEGTKFWECELDGYGKPKMLVGENGSCPFRYQGQYEDVETGLYYNRFRYYDGEQGNYISQDPIGLKGGKQFYGYVKDANSYIDTLGLSSTVLNGNLGGVTGDKMQAHHLIPEKVWANKQAFLDRIGLAGQRDHGSNGVLLHDNHADGLANGKAVYHSGSHQNYSDMVQARITNIENAHAIHGDDARARLEIANLQNRLRTALDRRSRGGCSRLS
jgi:RHS repeat-associated protein